MASQLAHGASTCRSQLHSLPRHQNWPRALLSKILVQRSYGDYILSEFSLIWSQVLYEQFPADAEADSPPAALSLRFDTKNLGIKSWNRLSKTRNSDETAARGPMFYKKHIQFIKSGTLLTHTGLGLALVIIFGLIDVLVTTLGGDVLCTLLVRFFTSPFQTWCLYPCEVC
ncbi:hypothetical protein BDV10DRAFT_146767 [Aspergillus recurvatus]